jgi:N-acetyl-anhydromuramyl-L-alanine amidase AmpD
MVFSASGICMIDIEAYSATQILTMEQILAVIRRRYPVEEQAPQRPQPPRGPATSG